MLKIDAKMFGDMVPHTTYIYYDGPLIYTVRHNEREFFVYSCDQDKESMSFLIREASPDDLAALENNEVKLRDFIINAEPLYFFKMFNTNTPHADAAYVIIDKNQCSEDNLPNPDVYLMRD